MYNSGGLIPARFLTLLGHFCVATSLLWETQESVRSCSSEEMDIVDLHKQQNQFTWCMSLAIVLMVFESFTFLTGLTMFQSSVSLISIFCHAGGCICLASLVLDNWSCSWLIPIFVFTSILPAIAEVLSAINSLCNGV